MCWVQTAALPGSPRHGPPWFPGEVRWEGRSKPLIGSAIVAMAAAIVTIANVVIAVVVEPQQSWSLGEGGGEGCGGRDGGEGGSDLAGKAFYPVTRLDKFANFSGKAKPPSYPVAIPR